MLCKENNQAINGLSKNYRHVNSLDVHAVLADHGFIEKGYREARVRKPEKIGFQKHISIFTRPDMAEKCGDFNVMLINGHDGSTAVQLHCGYFRFVCENQLINSELGLRVLHTGDVLEKLNKGIPKLIHRYEDFRALKERMEKKDLSQEAHQALLIEAIRLRELDAMDVEGPLKDQIIAYNLKAMDYTRRIDDRGLNSWRVLNRIQENVIKGTRHDIATTTKTGGINFRRLRAVTHVDRVVRFNKQLTQKAAELLGVA